MNQENLSGLETVENQYLDGRAVMQCGDETAAEVDRELRVLMKDCYKQAKALLEETQRKCEDQLAQTQSQCEQLQETARKAADAYWEDARQKIDEYHRARVDLQQSLQMDEDGFTVPLQMLENLGE